ncbi:unnamed protein product, partial [Scytosiphon promiscuus]
LDAKTENEAGGDPSNDKDLVAQLIRDFSAPATGDRESAWCTQLFRGMVVASRMAAIVHAPDDVGQEFLKNLRQVSAYTTGFASELRPGESLGVHLGLVKESLREDDTVDITDYYAPDAMKSSGMAVPPFCLTAKGIAV